MIAMFLAAMVAARIHAQTEYPNECVGIITPDGEYVPLVNIHPDPSNAFEISASDLMEWKDQIACVVHSHCYEIGDSDALMVGPSKDDMEAAIEMGCPWAIIPCIDRRAGNPLFWGDFLLDEPLIGRSFVPQITDCYELIRSAYWQWYKILLPSFPRDWEWWTEGGDLYNDGFSKAGFSVIDIEDALPGDVILASINTDVPNHAVLLLSGGRVLHHRQGKLSKRESIGPWMKMGYFGKALRHTSFADSAPPVPPDEPTTSN